jgi:hypothetical protein
LPFASRTAGDPRAAVAGTGAGVDGRAGAAADATSGGAGLSAIGGVADDAGRAFIGAAATMAAGSGEDAAGLTASATLVVGLDGVAATTVGIDGLAGAGITLARAGASGSATGPPAFRSTSESARPWPFASNDAGEPPDGLTATTVFAGAAASLGGAAANGLIVGIGVAAVTIGGFGGDATAATTATGPASG